MVYGSQNTTFKLIPNKKQFQKRSIVQIYLLTRAYKVKLIHTQKFMHTLKYRYKHLCIFYTVHVYVHINIYRNIYTYGRTKRNTAIKMGTADSASE